VKKTIAVVLALAMLFALASCAKKDAEVPEAPSVSDTAPPVGAELSKKTALQSAAEAITAGAAVEFTAELGGALFSGGTVSVAGTLDISAAKAFAELNFISPGGTIRGQLAADGGVAYAAFPELSDVYVRLSADDLSAALASYPQELPELDPGELAALFQSLSDGLLPLFEENQTVETGFSVSDRFGNTAEVDLYTVKIDARLAAETARVTLETLLQSGVLTGFADGLSIPGFDVTAELEKQLDAINETLGSGGLDAYDATATVSYGLIGGRLAVFGLRLDGEELPAAEFTFSSLEPGFAGFELTADADGTSLYASGSLDGSNASFEATLTENSRTRFELAANIAETDGALSVAASVKAYGAELFKLTATLKPGAAAVVVPSFDPANAWNPTDSTDAENTARGERFAADAEPLKAWFTLLSAWSASARSAKPPVA
jgi:hypothetical protein